MAKPRDVKPFLKNGAWAYRATLGGIRQFHGDFETEALALADLDQRRAEHMVFTKPLGDGPDLTTLDTALTNYALETLPHKKGARQEVDRINRYLRATGRPVLKLAPFVAQQSIKAKMRESSTPVLPYFTLSLGAPSTSRKVPNGLTHHRQTLAQESAKTAYQRKRLAQTKVSDISAVTMQAFVHTMIQDGYSASTVHKEVALLRQLFNRARVAWKWSKLALNPTTGLELPEIDNARDRILSENEWAKLVEPLARYDNPYALPLVCMMLETAMRSCEPLTLMTWGDIDWKQRILHLPDGKTGKRDVPLGPGALLILAQMRARLPDSNLEDRVFPTTYESLKKAWRVACEKAQISGIKPHDLRHTSATRYSLEFHGNLAVLKLITGHKTTKMVERYVNLTATQVSTLMHGEELTSDLAPAGHITDVAAHAVALISHKHWLRPRKRINDPDPITSNAVIAMPMSTEAIAQRAEADMPAALPPIEVNRSEADRPDWWIGQGNKPAVLPDNVIQVNFSRAA